MRVLVGTVLGLFELGADARHRLAPLAAREITALVREGRRTWVLSEGRSIWRSGEDGAWEIVAHVETEDATCLLPSPAGLFVGTEGARLLRLEGGTLRPVEAFLQVEGRREWFTPWGEPPAVRSMACDPTGTLYVNVHVGGVVRSTDGGKSWRPTVDIHVDVHQVACDPRRPGVVWAASAAGLGVSEDAGESWRFLTEGLHAHYLRAVALGEGALFVSASRGPEGRQAAVYRQPLAEGALAGAPLERCTPGLPDWFDDNIDTGCLAAAGRDVAFGTAQGALWASADEGRHWALLAQGLPEIRGVVLA
jgi:photosystem II stability/assembly factor-like uncharacterized protein